MEQLTLEQAALKAHRYNFGIPKDWREIERMTETVFEKHNVHSFKAGAEWQKEQIVDLLKQILPFLHNAETISPVEDIYLNELLCKCQSIILNTKS